MNRLLRVFAVFLACILFLMGAVIAEEEDETDFDSLPLSVQELLKDRTYYESALSFVFCERRDERERRIEVEQKQGIAPTSAENWKWGFYDKKSGYIQQPCYDEIYDLDCDDADAPILVGIGENYGHLVRSSGAIAIPFVYGYCGENSEFVNDYAVVEKREATGECHDVLITTSGEEIAFPEGYELTSFVYQDKIVVSYCFECEDEYSGIYYDFLYGLGTTNGEIYLRPQYDYISNFHEGYACIQIEHRWGHMDADGNIIVPPIYDLDEEEMGGAGYYFENGVAKLVLQDGNTIYINYAGEEVAPDCY